MKRRIHRLPIRHSTQRPRARRRPGQITVALVNAVAAAVSGSVAAWVLSHIPW
ncbi:hypothetical protein [Streptomyces sp. NRRL B-24484]|uniref:hypothetical protein n=1 Tax=Streptomyces sp. NRRL B-24484 TaxID=1463833 RepID=UPI000A72AA0E|nr:hypothetical protein [Streptomyces sp. NRRL B-24484]